MAAIVFDTLNPTAPANVEPALTIQPMSTRRVAIEWPAAHGALVLESVTAYSPTGWIFTVADQVPVANADKLRLTNTATAATRFYRLSRP
jgi:hypothetical protein